MNKTISVTVGRYEREKQEEHTVSVRMVLFRLGGLGNISEKVIYSRKNIFKNSALLYN